MGLALMLYYECISSTEEAFLSAKFGKTYTDWAGVTPAFLPRFSGWRAPVRRFSWRMVIRREHPSIYGALFALFLIDLGFSRLAALPEDFPTAWLWVMLAATVMIAGVKLAKRHGDLLAPR